MDRRSIRRWRMIRTSPCTAAVPVTHNIMPVAAREALTGAEAASTSRPRTAPLKGECQRSRPCWREA